MKPRVTVRSTPDGYIMTVAGGGMDYAGTYPSRDAAFDDAPKVIGAWLRREPHLPDTGGAALRGPDGAQYKGDAP